MGIVGLMQGIVYTVYWFGGSQGTWERTSLSEQKDIQKMKETQMPINRKKRIKAEIQGNGNAVEYIWIQNTCIRECEKGKKKCKWDFFEGIWGKRFKKKDDDGKVAKLQRMCLPSKKSMKGIALLGLNASPWQAG